MQINEQCAVIRMKAKTHACVPRQVCWLQNSAMQLFNIRSVSQSLVLVAETVRKSFILERSGIMVHLTDGGFGTHLEKHYVGDSLEGDQLWSARFNVTRPEVVQSTHRDFLLAGADLIRTNTYQASVPGYRKYMGLSEEECEKTFAATIDLALKAREEFVSEWPEREGKIKVLASIGPYGAWLSDGSEYSGSYGETVPDDVIKSFHKERLDVILRSHVDGLAVETIPLQKEAEIIVDLLNEWHPNVKFWVSFSCKVSRERERENLVV